MTMSLQAPMTHRIQTLFRQHGLDPVLYHTLVVGLMHAAYDEVDKFIDELKSRDIVR